ncbi:MAG: hypothetical protein ABSE06_20275, partial [Anaerolineaceae bacterium]
MPTKLNVLSIGLLIIFSLGCLAGCVPGFGGAGIPPTFNAPTIVEAKPTLILTATSTPSPTQTPVSPTATLMPTETATPTLEPSATPTREILSSSQCMSDFNKWETAPAPPGEWGNIDAETFRSNIANLNHLIAGSGLVEAQMQVAGIKGKPFDQSVIVKTKLVSDDSLPYVSLVFLQQGMGSRPYALYPEKRNMWPV